MKRILMAIMAVAVTFRAPAFTGLFPYLLDQLIDPSTTPMLPWDHASFTRNTKA